MLNLLNFLPGKAHHILHQFSYFKFACFLGVFLIVVSCQETSREQNTQNTVNAEVTESTDDKNQTYAAPRLKPGHIVMQVSDLERSQKFYEDHLDLRTTEEVIYEGEKRIFMSASDSHHELVLLEPRKEEFLPSDIRQLQQLAFEVNSHEELVRFYDEIKNTGIPHVIKDNQVSLSLYFPDPDSVTIELYWDIQDEPFGERQWNGNLEDITEGKFRNPYENLAGE